MRSPSSTSSAPLKRRRSYRSLGGLLRRFPSDLWCVPKWRMTRWRRFCWSCWEGRARRERPLWRIKSHWDSLRNATRWRGEEIWCNTIHCVLCWPYTPHDAVTCCTEDKSCLSPSPLPLLLSPTLLRPLVLLIGWPLHIWSHPVSRQPAQEPHHVPIQILSCYDRASVQVRNLVSSRSTILFSCYWFFQSLLMGLVSVLLYTFFFPFFFKYHIVPSPLSVLHLSLFLSLSLLPWLRGT